LINIDISIGPVVWGGKKRAAHFLGFVISLPYSCWNYKTIIKFDW